MRKFILIGFVLLVAFIIFFVYDPENPSPPLSQIRGKYVFIRDYDEYTEHIHTTGLPSGFVPYSGISSLGAFTSYTDPGYRSVSYYYEVLDQNNFPITFTVHHAPYAYSWANEISSALPFPEGVTDVQLGIGLGDSKAYTRHGLTYIYDESSYFSTMAWIEDGKEYEISLNSRYPRYLNDTFILRLLSPDESVSEAAFNELRAQIKANTPPVKEEPIWPYVGAAAAILVLAFVLPRVGRRRST